MNNNNWQRFSIFIVVAIFSIYIGFLLSPKINPSRVDHLKITDEQVHQITREFLHSIHIDPGKYIEYSYFNTDQNSINFIISELGVEKLRELNEKDLLPLSHWRVNYLLDVPKNSEEDWITFNVSPAGKIISYRHFLPDSAAAKNVDSLEALQIAKNYMNNWPGGNNFSGFKLEKHNTYAKPNRQDNEYIFSKTHPELPGGKEEVYVYLAGNMPVSLRNIFTVPDDANIQAVSGTNILFYAVSILVYFIITIIGIMKFLKLYHDGQIGVQRALVAGFIVYFAQALYIINYWDGFAENTGIGTISRINTRWIVFGMQMFITYVYLMVNSFTTWAVGDFLLRTEKPVLLAGTDALFSRKFFTKNIGRELPVGFALGATLFGIIHVLNYLLIEFTDAVPLATDTFIGSEIPLLAMVLMIILTAFFNEVVFRKFLVTYLKIVVNSKTFAFLISGVVYAVFGIFFGEFINFWPTYITLIPFFVIGVFQAWVFWNYGLLASMSSAMMYIGLYVLSFVLWVDNPVYPIQGIIFILLLLILLVTGLLGFFKGKEFHFTYKSEPEHISRIKERLRMQQELDIAKKVQLGLLPKEQPNLNGFDIAGICIPALEVGGDYFDFISLKDDRLGLAIADVSGKGVPAAIYMTLTKGILQSHAESDLSPKTVLSKVNSLMYRTIEKSWYVSMFYAVLDPPTKKLRFSRAGHNPAIVLNQDKSDPQLLQPAGIGLGLEMGEIFTKTLVEGELQLESGNTLIFYTDGFTEAMNEKGEEYGEDRFLEFLNTNDQGSSNELVKKAVKEINKFTDGAPQHDDMTMVVLKVY